MSAAIVWLFFGVSSVAFCFGSWHLSFKTERWTLGTVILTIIGIALPPLAIFVGIMNSLFWAFGGPEHPEGAKEWPLWWGRFRYRQHRLWRKIWHLGKPPVEEDWLSSWRHTPKAYIC